VLRFGVYIRLGYRVVVGDGLGLLEFGLRSVVIV